MQRVLVTVLVALTLLLPVRPQVEAQETEENHSNNRGGHQPTVLNMDHYLLQLNNKLDTLNSKLDILDTAFSQHKEQVMNEVAQLQTLHTTTQSFLETVNSKLEEIDAGLFQHQQQPATELAQLHTSLTTTQFFLATHTQHVDAKLNTMTTSLSQYKQQTAAELAQLQTSLTTSQSSVESKLDRLLYLRENLSSLNHSVSDLSVCLQEHKQQTAADAQQLNSRLDNLTAIQQCDCQQDSLTQTTTATTATTPTTITTPCTPTPPVTIPPVPTYTCGGTGGWRRVVYLDMTDPSTTCPSGWNMTGYSKRTCGRATDGYNTCDSVTFPVSGGEYSRVCGRIRAYQWGGAGAFFSYHRGDVTSIDGAYVGGISVTHSNPRQHIWTFAAGLSENSIWESVCPCDISRNMIRIPPFVGEDYFCESGINEPWQGGSRHLKLHSNDTLWDGKNCLSSSTCCSLHNPPYFVKQLPAPTSGDIEARMCLTSSSVYDDLAVELIDLYMQ